jgi:hypothetical protein
VIVHYDVLLADGQRVEFAGRFESKAHFERSIVQTEAVHKRWRHVYIVRILEN